MIEITKSPSVKCQVCNQNPGQYAIKGEAAEWGGPRYVCQPCMIGMAKTDELIKDVLLLQAATGVH
jgi:hypothetical protein